MNGKELMLYKYEIIEKIMNSKKIDKNDKVYYIEMFLKGWFEEKEIKWIWTE